MSRESFIARVEREMPAGTVISNPKWWAERLWKWSQQSWTPYKKGDDVAYDTNALVTYEFLPLGCNEYGVTEAWFRSEGWETIDDEIIDNVTAYRQLPAPYGGE